MGINGLDSVLPEHEAEVLYLLSQVPHDYSVAIKKVEEGYEFELSYGQLVRSEFVYFDRLTGFTGGIGAFLAV